MMILGLSSLKLIVKFENEYDHGKFFGDRRVHQQSHFWEPLFAHLPRGWAVREGGEPRCVLWLRKYSVHHNDTPKLSTFMSFTTLQGVFGRTVKSRAGSTILANIGYMDLVGIPSGACEVTIEFIVPFCFYFRLSCASIDVYWKTECFVHTLPIPPTI